MRFEYKKIHPSLHHAYKDGVLIATFRKAKVSDGMPWWVLGPGVDFRASTLRNAKHILEWKT